MGNINKFSLFKQSIIHAVFEGAELEGLGLTYAKTEDILKHYDKSKDNYT
ncbi:hypothetical protein FACS1894166_06640 [Bacilli bacterium]|nr:hypothetical protein FACS1894166_06640 [Bacilli bacterium]